MRMRRVDSVFWSWMVVAAFLAGILSPAVAQRGSAAGPWPGICTSAGTSGIERTGDAPQLPARAQLVAHCPLCTLHSGMLGLPSTAGIVVALLASRFALPQPLPATPGASPLWSSAQARAPPKHG